MRKGLYDVLISGKVFGGGSAMEARWVVHCQGCLGRLAASSAA